MRIVVCLIILAGIVLLAGCGGSAATPSTTTTGTMTTTPEVTTTAATMAGTTVTPSTTTSSSTPTSTVTTVTTATTTAVTTATTTAVTTTTSVSGDKDALSAYLGVVMPIVERHNGTKDATREAGDTFAMAPPFLNAVADYRDALAGLKPDVDVELADAMAIVPPSGYTDFHASFVAAITHQHDGITLHLQYYSEVADNGTAEQELYDRGAQAFNDANQWYQIVLPHLQELIDEANS